MLRNKIVYFKKIYNFAADYFFLGVRRYEVALSCISKFNSIFSKENIIESK